MSASSSSARPAARPKHPDWFHNVVADPRVHVEDGAFSYDATAVVLEGAERDAAFARAAEADPGWADYQAQDHPRDPRGRDRSRCPAHPGSRPARPAVRLSSWCTTRSGVSSR